MRAVGEELWEIEQLFQVKDREDGEDAHPFQLEKKKGSLNSFCCLVFC